MRVGRIVWCAATILLSGAFTMSEAGSIHPEIFRQYCGEAQAGYIVRILKNDKGEIGGYVATRKVRDSAIVYFDAQANKIGGFHIYAKPGENAKDKPKIDDLLKRFPLTETLQCPK